MEPKKLETRHEEQTQTRQQAAERGALEFESPDELLRYDQEHTSVPARLARRLSESLARECASARSWWHRLWHGNAGS